tara:strand:- start:12037 stop:13014 length:978 start_codon:yes stop_codon:yes gene_type:complete
MKIYYQKANESWIVDRIGEEFKDNSIHTVEFGFHGINNFNFDAIWLGASYAWRMITRDIDELRLILENTPTFCTIHHIVPWKWNEDKHREFMLRDQFVDMYHTYTKETASIIKEISNKPVIVIPHWVNSKIWHPLDKKKCREELGLGEDKFIIGSFQRDTEGSDLKSPKLEKGPDIFIEMCKEFNMNKWNVEVLLGGNRRQFVINELNRLGISYKYFENSPTESVNKMYSACDLYAVSSRCEGGPQAIFEASATKTSIISTDCGQSRDILDSRCIYQLESISLGQHMNYEVPDNSCIDINYKSAMKYDITRHIKNFDKAISEIVK